MPNTGPYSQDVLTRIINVQWGGGGAIAVMGHEVADEESTAGKRYWGQPATKNTPPLPSGTPLQEWRLISSNNVSFRAQSFALIKQAVDRLVPTFLLGVGWTEIEEIHLSHDAQNWSIVHTNTNNGGLGCTGLVWKLDGNEAGVGNFYAAFDRKGFAPDDFWNGQIWSSSDGVTWGLVQEFKSDSQEQVADQQAAMELAFKGYCTKPENAGGVPDGLQGYDSDNKVLIKPESLSGWQYSGPAMAASPRLIVEGGDNPGIRTLPIAVYGVCFNGGVWNALGWDVTVEGFSKPIRVFVSIDGGETWKLTYETAGWVPAGIISGAKADM
jgi:hypothetical protein